jgi:hypothetical protein
MKIKLFKKENNFKKKDFELNPNLYWKLALGGAFVIILFSFFFGYNLFMKINEDSVMPNAGASDQVLMVNKDHILKVLNYFSEREQKSIQIINSSSPVVDPSL